MVATSKAWRATYRGDWESVLREYYTQQQCPEFARFSTEHHAAFDNGRKSKAVEDANHHKIEQLEAKLQRKDSVLAELMEEHILLKKVLGRADRPLAPP